MNRLFVAYKPSHISSNGFLSKLKRKYKVKKAGFTGTLDPFAKGVLVVGFGSYTKLFRFLKKTPKTYQATLWLGAKSASLDSEMIENVEILPPLPEEKIQTVLQSLQGELEYEPPIFSAKSINGQRAYDLARANKEVKLQKITSTIYDIKLISYMHPFVTFKATVSEGTYIRSLGAIIASRLGIEFGSLSALERLREGVFVYENEKSLLIKEVLDIPRNTYYGDPMNIFYGKVLDIADFAIQKDGHYWIDNDTTISIITIENKKVKYELNKVDIC
ncbi:tRNA pseudouridine synthase B [hydrothermal vent metagenome]|uniref:tRNA pseudouridine(55) synthase n=1 Tax=hydrothermal vent metagenome TaxID=652676 RepID=A0A1W1D2E2_9ZZZZ